MASERDEQKRSWYWELIEGRREAAPRLIFVDETGFNTDLVRRYGRAARGARVVAAVPRNTPPNLTFVGALAPEGLITGMELEGAVDSAAFVAFVDRFLLPELAPGDVVVMDNLSAHHAPRVSELIAAAGAWLLYLPSYSPDFNPIEQCFSKMKTLLRGIAARTRVKLRRAIRQVINTVTSSDVQGWFEDLNYWVTSKGKPL